MPRSYRFQQGMAAVGQQYQQASATPSLPPEKKYVHAPLYLDEIKQGKRAELVIPGDRLSWRYPAVRPCFLVITSGRDLWLCRDSNMNGYGLFYEDMPLATFAAGCPQEISWPIVRAGRDMRITLVIENRSPARNAGRLIGRLSAYEVSPDAYD